jgi:alpha-tubulin suppressor-like RCC1 family protein
MMELSGLLEAIDSDSLAAVRTTLLTWANVANNRYVATLGEKSCNWERVKLGERIVAIASGWSHCLALTRDGVVFCWGRAGTAIIRQNVCALTRMESDMGQLGVSDERVRVFPAPLCLPDAIAEVFCGSEHSLCLSRCRTRLYAFGWNEHGNIGIGTASETVQSPQLVPFFVDEFHASNQRIQLIATGGATVLAATTDSPK